MRIDIFRNLRNNDEFETFYKKKWQRVRVVANPELRGDRVLVSVHPTNRNLSEGAIEKQVYQADVQVQVLDRSPVLLGADDIYERYILDVLRPGRELISCDQLIKEIERFRKASPTSVRRVANNLARLRVIHRKRCVWANKSGFRGLIPNFKGFPVVGNFQTRSERYGWVEGHTYSVQSKRLEPVVQWLDGSSTLISDSQIEPLPRFMTFIRKRIVIAQQVVQDASERDLIELPAHLIYEALHTDSTPFLQNRAMRELARILKDAGAIEFGRYTHDARNELIDYLDHNHPGWRYGSIYRGVA